MDVVSPANGLAKPIGTFQLLRLPHDLIFQIFSYLKWNQLAPVCRACKQCNALASDDRVWRQITRRDFPGMISGNSNLKLAMRYTLPGYAWGVLDLAAQHSLWDGSLWNVIDPLLETKMLEQMIAQCDNLDNRDEEGNTPVLSALQTDHERVALALLRAGACREAQTEEGYGVLHVATWFSLRAVEYMLATGTDVDMPDREGRTALHVAVDWGDEVTTLQLLLSAGANVNARDGHGRTPLHLAAADSDAAVLNVLLEHGADPHLRDGYGETALDIADRLGRDEAMGVLLKVPKRARDGNSKLALAQVDKKQRN